MIDFINFQNTTSNLKSIPGFAVLSELGVRVELDLPAVVPVGLLGLSLFDFRCVAELSFSF